LAAGILVSQSGLEAVGRFLFFSSRRATIGFAVAMVGLLILCLFSVRQNILTYDNTRETLYFVLIVTGGWGIGSWILLGYVRKTISSLQRKAGPFISILHYSMTGIQFALFGVMLFVIFDRKSEYLMPIVNAITSIIATILLGVFAYQFSRWYKHNKRNLVILFYCLATVALAIMIATDFARVELVTIKVDKSAPGETSREVVLYKQIEGGELIKQDIEPDYTKSYIIPAQYQYANYLIAQWPGLLSFIFGWAATSLTLHNYNSSLNRIVLWILISVPLILYIVGNIPDLLDFTGTSINPEPWTRILFRSGTVGTSILFGLAFLVMAQRIRPIRDHLTVAAIGVMTIIVAFAILNLQQTFGVAAHSLILLFSYMFAIGLYSSAISISHDATLRRDIKRSVKSASSDLLDGAGRAQMVQEIESKVIRIATQSSNALFVESGVPPSLQEVDMRNYVQQVLYEIQGKTFVDNRSHTDSEEAQG
jgi:uncharacterized membrane protein YGL010W